MGALGRVAVASTLGQRKEERELGTARHVPPCDVICLYTHSKCRAHFGLHGVLQGRGVARKKGDHLDVGTGGVASELEMKIGTTIGPLNVILPLTVQCI